MKKSKERCICTARTGDDDLGPLKLLPGKWIEELCEKGKHGYPKLHLQYAQVVILDFFGRLDQLPGLAQWPHVSINTLEKVYD